MPSPHFFDRDLPRWTRHSFDPFGRNDDPFTSFPRYGYWTKDEGSSVKVDAEKWQISVDVQHFTPDEITVKIIDGFIVVEGKQEEKQDEHGFVFRHFVRRFQIPVDTNPNGIQCRLSSDGVLAVAAPRMEAPKGERLIPIEHTGPVSKEIKEQKVNSL